MRERTITKEKMMKEETQMYDTPAPSVEIA
jgi:hypothetical protein